MPILSLHIDRAVLILVLCEDFQHNLHRFFCSFGYLSRPLFIRALFFCLINYWNNIYNKMTAGGCCGQSTERLKSGHDTEE